MQEWVFFLVGIGLAAFSILLTFHFMTGRRLNVFFNTSWAIDRFFSDEKDLEISFKGKRIVGLVHHRVYLWNSGNKSIKLDDIDPAIPLRFVKSKGSNIHSVDIAKTSDTFQFNVTRDGDGGLLTFNHLDVGRGVILDFYESVESYEDFQPLHIDGYIIESKGIIQGVGPTSFRESISNIKDGWLLFFGICLFVTIVVAIFRAFSWYFYDEKFRLFNFSDNPWWLNVAFLSVFVFLSLYLTFSSPLKALIYRIPRFDLVRSSLPQKGARWQQYRAAMMDPVIAEHMLTFANYAEDEK